METITPLLEKKKQEEFDQKVAEDVLLEAFLEQLKERHKNVCLSLFILFNVLMFYNRALPIWKQRCVTLKMT